MTPTKFCVLIQRAEVNPGATGWRQMTAFFCSLNRNGCLKAQGHCIGKSVSHHSFNKMYGSAALTLNLWEMV